MTPGPWTTGEALELHQNLLALGWRVAAAESLTCGRIQTALGALGGASAYFAGGLTAYSIAAKVAWLGVDEAAARAANAVSPEIALQMARGVATRFSAELGLATTGYAEPSPADQVARPFAFVAVVSPTRESVERVELPPADRCAAQAAAAAAALRLLLKSLPAPTTPAPPRAPAPGRTRPEVT